MVEVLDRYYLAITLLVTIAYQLIGFSIAFTFKFDKLTDFCGGTNFIILAILTLALNAGSNVISDRQYVASIFMMAWGARLAGFLLFRILKTGSDSRFDDKRNKFFPFLGFWVAQMLWVWVVSLPVTILNSPAVQAYRQPDFGNGRDIAGIVLFALGLILESGADVQKYLFKSNHKGDKGAVCDTGFWAWTRHPNYFGEIIIQFSIFMIAVSAAASDFSGIPNGSGAYNALYASILGPFFLTVLLLFVSGLPLQERPAAKKRYESGNNWEGYKRYLESTSILIPIPPQIYRPLPTWVKRTVLMEWPPFVFDPRKHADQKAIEERQSEEGRSNEEQNNGERS